MFSKTVVTPILLIILKEFFQILKITKKSFNMYLATTNWTGFFLTFSRRNMIQLLHNINIIHWNEYRLCYKKIQVLICLIIVMLYVIYCYIVKWNIISFTSLNKIERSIIWIEQIIFSKCIHKRTYL